MHILSVILIGLSTNLDNFCMAVALGMGKKRIPLPANICISAISGAAAFLAAMGASFLLIGDIANLLGGLLIAGMGVWTIASSFLQKVEKDMKVKNLDVKQTLIMGCALALNCLPVAFGAGAAGISAAWISVFIAVFSFLSIDIGGRVGTRVGKMPYANWINALSGLLLIALGLLQIFA